ncbi:hypothetical protein F5B21DRAFT_440157 [Xylaria acuta]|nr:hypothetical protein F5B21DRAFT_440157 [Xylaria acuta]
MISNSVAEINLGMFCASIPVAFSLFRDFSQMLTSMKSFSIWRSRKTPKRPASWSTPNINAETINQPKLPSVANGTLGTPPSFARGPTSLRRRDDQGVVAPNTTDIEMVPYVEIRTIQSINMRI